MIKEWINYFKENGVSHDPNNGIQKVLDFQDYIGRQTATEAVSEIIAVWEEDQGFLENACWVLCATLDVQVAGHLIKEVLWQTQFRTIEENMRLKNEEYLAGAKEGIESKYRSEIHSVKTFAKQCNEKNALLKKQIDSKDCEIDELRERICNVREAMSTLRAI